MGLGKKKQREWTRNSRLKLLIITNSEHGKNHTRQRCVRIWQRSVMGRRRAADGANVHGIMLTEEVTRCDVPFFFSTYDHHTEEPLTTTTTRRPTTTHHHTMPINPHHRKSVLTSGLQANTAPTKATLRRQPPTTTQDGDECPQTTPTAQTHEQRRASANTDNDPNTTTLDRQQPPRPTSYEGCSSPPATKPPSDYRTTAHSPGKPTGEEERPPQPPTNDEGIRKRRQWPPLLASDERGPPATMTNGDDGRRER